MTDNRDYLVKPKEHPRTVSDWKAVNNQPRDGSDDEFDMATCKAPVYDTDNKHEGMFRNGTPDFDGEILSCFDEPNLLYRIINQEEKTWAFYNDSLNYEMHVEFTFGKYSKLEALGKTTMVTNAEDEFVTSVVVYPTETELFVKGNVNGFTSKLRAVPLSEDYHKACNEIADKTIQDETDAIKKAAPNKTTSEEVLKVCIEKKIPFVDPEFPPCQESLEKGSKKPFKPLAWARPKMYLPKEMIDQVRLFRTNTAPGVVDAGELGDAWVMCSIATVSENPSRLMAMFRHPDGKSAAEKERAVGAYRVTFCKNGWWQSVIVDDYLPICADRPKYAKSATDPAEIWPCILEKAFAKLHGSYGRIRTGDPLHALHDMTGFSTYRFDGALQRATSTNDDALFKELMESIGHGYNIMCSTPGKDADHPERVDEYRSVGLVTGHAYSILDAKFFPEADAHIIKVRNAWGRGLEWKGEWSDEDEKWKKYPKIAKACDFEPSPDGTFWMPWKDALKYFNGGGICFAHSPAFDYRMHCKFTDCIPSVVLEVTVEAPVWLTLVISQVDKRARTDGSDYQPVMISVAEPQEGDLFKVVKNSSANGFRPNEDKWTFLQARDVSLVSHFKPGKYIMCRE